ncbi:SAC3 family protein 2 [Quillaja saponaria]|uniref:SAC3 family protein 2 n=1 Tax=Quillaja saponaria TaxID=32244 RepID=A0AAD7PC62_QUISA|nr:SAC3 family protein 2 [Quillaja saponaria]
MEHHQRQNRNSSSTSYDESAHSRGKKIPTKQTRYSKFSNFNQRGTPSNTTDWDKGVHLKTRKSSQEEEDEDTDDSANVPFLIGTCPFMCPGGERTQREQLRDLAVFERLNGNPRKSSPGLAVKKFCRTISTKHVQASGVRPLPVLEDTLKYLLNLLDTKEQPFEVIHDFIFDRTRSIRQDLSMQNIVNDKAIYMYEAMVKFHVISHHKLRSCANSASIHYLNMEQLSKTLTSLFDLYEANQDSNLIYKNEAEFRSLYVLLHLDSYSKPAGESLSLWFRLVSPPVMRSTEMCFARKILRSFRMGNYKRFHCTTAAEASYLQYCVIEPYINEVRAMALSCINSVCYKLHPYPLADLSKLLMMKESDLECLCSACSLETCTNESGDKLLSTKQTTFCYPKGGFQSYSFLGLEEFERMTEKE